ncbi:GNAT family N-acetyltransferase [Streptomyces sp. NBC_01233]|uniref:GNAT family N-acetyltransferase n=1 Tax=Streptomyces sp. NBC_01233 TaxID=2903787 RepID=UPI002E0F7BF1|nr:GNAT family N-acetyltransferase [Streptomyces sp. NBC_01233]
MNARTAPPSSGYGIRCARPAEARAVATLLAGAFADDPVMTWMVPGPAGRERRIAVYFKPAQRQQRPRAGGVRVAATGGGRLLASALWSGPGRWKTSAVKELAAMPYYARVFGTRRMPRAADVQNALHEVHPDAPHWYLSTLGTDPALQGAGIGSALVREQPAHCDRLGEPAYLESGKASDVPFHERFGFRVTHEIRLPDDGPTLWTMWREPGRGTGPVAGGRTRHPRR